MKKRTIRVLIADDHNLVLDGICSLLKDIAYIKIVGRAEDGRELVKKYFELQPDVVLSDISMPILSGADAAQNILRKNKTAKILFVSQYVDDDYIYSILKVGGLGLLSKNCNTEDIVLGIESVIMGKHYFVNKSEEELNHLIQRFEQNKIKSKQPIHNELSKKQKEILKLIGQGLTSNQIAIKLKIDKRTVDTHRHRMMQTLEFKSSAQLFRHAVIFCE
ncbi:MAG: response regulator transcription factor, partial [Ignavibacteriae bacterium]|nr:response regulator transcription factor [Ignavibacteriota bacterium]